MAGWTNESFLEMIQREYPNFDWAGLPDLESSPSHWELHALNWRRIVFIQTGREIRSTVGVTIGRDYLTREEAQVKFASLRTDPEWCQEILIRDKSSYPVPSLHYHGPLLFDSVRVLEFKDHDLILLHYYRHCLDRIRRGDKVFPCYLP